ncbi:tail fiber assembly protein [Pseudomonas sp. TKO26]|uniref:tail fiber assembly protein n=1 Tax=unclassified Pseudomonas TaxID=196821 RepID=UPI000D941CA5|nr:MULTISPECIES: tail fiber assembly protein [unclassified Pseudomonas]PYY88558.1 tail fiber assembly protein [Pseudomonas sp. TKO30]PYY91418.1 tail fiber assembly protein [Pseudomonas sp. TKO29]PYY94073.1 tail fiber assembly protein [Pseudomonas sp. TKO26]PYZ00787.1 tail fiber assembly protein [Pseudomonas sp. TKO14]
MANFSSRTEKTFFDDFINTTLPPDAVELSSEEYLGLLLGIAAGKKVDWSGERPALVDPSPPSAEQLQQSAYSQRDYLLGIAALRIAPLQDAVDGEVATDDEVSLLELWKSYRVALNRIQTQSGFPSDIAWPDQPG